MPDENERGLELMVQSIDGDTAKLRVIRDYRAGKTPVWGIHAKTESRTLR